MAITINISDTGGGQPPMTAELMPLDAGKSGALAATTPSDPAVHMDSPGEARDGGAPSASLLQEVEEALRAAGLTMQQTASPNDQMNAGAAPV